jgi:RNA-binding protein 4
MQYKKDADDALRNLNGVVLKGIKIKVQMSEKQDLPKTSHQSIKLFVGNLSEVTTKEELKALFENYTKVLEADVVKNYGFVHIDAEGGKNKLDYIFQELNDYNLNGNEIRVQQSTSSVRQRPGMQGDLCYREPKLSRNSIYEA